MRAIFIGPGMARILGFCTSLIGGAGLLSQAVGGAAVHAAEAAGAKDTGDGGGTIGEAGEAGRIGVFAAAFLMQDGAVAKGAGEVSVV